MNIVIVGYGRMGRLIEEVAQHRGHTVVYRVDPVVAEADGTDVSGIPSLAEGVVEFALPEGLGDRVGLYVERGLPAVIATTGWNHMRSSVVERVLSGGGTVVAGSNFGIGAALQRMLTDRLTRAIDQLEEYDVAVVETHHRHKVDSPSGTALDLARTIVGASTRKTTIFHGDSTRPPHDDEVQVSALRVGEVPGIHRVVADSAADSVEIVHTARSRVGFALGALRALEWVTGRPGFHDADEFFTDVLSSDPGRPS